MASSDSILNVPFDFYAADGYVEENLPAISSDYDFVNVGLNEKFARYIAVNLPGENEIPRKIGDYNWINAFNEHGREHGYGIVVQLSSVKNTSATKEETWVYVAVMLSESNNYYGVTYKVSKSIEDMSDLKHDAIMDVLYADGVVYSAYQFRYGRPTSAL